MQRPIHRQQKRKNNLMILFVFLICLIITMYQSSECIVRYFRNRITIDVTETKVKATDYPTVVECGDGIWKKKLEEQTNETELFSSFQSLLHYRVSEAEAFPWGTVSLQDYYDNLENTSQIYGAKFTYLVWTGVCLYSDEMQTLPTSRYYTDFNSNETSIVILISKESDLPRLYHNVYNEEITFIIMEGAADKIQHVKIESKTRLAVNSYKCESSSSNYSQTQCLEKCMLHKHLETHPVNCTLPWLKSLLDRPICSNYKEYKQLAETLQDARSEATADDSLEKCKIKCPDNCTNLIYSLSNTDNRQNRYGGDRSSLMLQVKSSVYVTNEYKEYDFTDLMADIGGIIGLFLGFSFLGLFSSLITICGKRKKSSPV